MIVFFCTRCVSKIGNGIANDLIIFSFKKITMGYIVVV